MKNIRNQSWASAIDIENLDLALYRCIVRHPLCSACFTFFLLASLIAPVIAEFIVHDDLLTRGAVYEETTPVLFELNLYTDLTIGFAYIFITCLLIFLSYKVGRDLPFMWAFIAFGVFIVACGATHLMGAFILWMPLYWIGAGIKWFTAIVSVGTALAIPPLIPKGLALVQKAKQRRIQGGIVNTDVFLRTKYDIHDIENFDLYVARLITQHPITSYTIIMLTCAAIAAPFLYELIHTDTLLTQYAVYEPSIFILQAIHIFTDVSIGLAYIAITAMLFWFALQAGRDLPFMWMFVLFGVFIAFCGVTHTLEAILVWKPIYWISGGVKLLTAIVSMGTALLIPPLIPKVIELIYFARSIRSS